MIIVDEALRRRAEEGRPVRVAVVGAGAIGRGLIDVILHHTPGMRLVAVANRTEARVAECLRSSGVDFERVSGGRGLADAAKRHVVAITTDPFLLCASGDIDVIIQVVSDIGHCATVALAAFAGGKHVVTANAEMDATFGLELRRRAEAAGVIYSVSDGDQPGVQMNLWRYVRAIGMEPLVCGNIKGLQDCRRNPETQAGFAAKWKQDARMVTSFADGTKISFEQACVANATGMSIECRGMRGGDFHGHVTDLGGTGRYDVEELRRLGGVVDYVVGAEPPAGIFVLATHRNPEHRFNLKLYKLGDGPLYCFYNPYHVCYFEMALSAARVVLFGDIILAARGHRVDVIAVAKEDLQAGTVIDGIGGFHCYGTCERGSVVAREDLLPMGLAEGCRIRRPIPRDGLISYADVDVPEGRLIDRLRRAQQEELTSQPS